MRFILTCVASDMDSPLTPEHIEKAQPILKTHGILEMDSIIESAKDEARILENGKVAEIEIEIGPESTMRGRIAMMHDLREMLFDDKIDILITRAGDRRKKLLIADMDSTIVAGETLDDLAAHAGIKDKIAAITARAMNGELDFHEAITERVGLLKGLPQSAVDETLAALNLNPKAKTFVQTMKKNGAHCVLVSGGFTLFTGPIAKDVGFDHHHGNTLGIENAALTGEVIPPILDKNAKVDFLQHYLKVQNIGALDAVTIGDGANDLPMLKAAQDEDGLGIGYKAKDSVAENLENLIIHGDFTAALYAQGYSADEIVKVD